MSKESTGSTSAGDVNRKTSQDIGNVESGSEASFGQNIGRSENPENEPSRRSNLGEQSSNEKSSRQSNQSWGDKRGEH
jgi:hypothetical protein